ncbi:helix-turn-helix domain-containing protein [Phycicoccus sp. Soil803]|uniref:AlbA family DNA-binding domain-containing protein n=1 Tax=Phycicoccus sp. Soil803 TaxID=1736415 RepID=UPI000709C155|nr:ATP-binding protein [Phycicoccus sp. Soil803]KRF25355.1 hypothetical protein ASG95_13325 [Phycicoccus sp. Soil803]
MPTTPLHLALGREPSDLTWELVQEAIDTRLEETDALDWKSALPAKEARTEFAKDVAAMANSGGGMIVYGVQEQGGGSSAAAAVTGIEQWDDGEERRLRQIAYSGIQPPVHGLTFRLLQHEHSQVVALSIPGSADSPHLVWTGTGFTAPIRYGAQTEFMREREIERAYRARFDSYAGLDATLDERIEQLRQVVSGPDRVWMIGSAVPLQPRPLHQGRVERNVIVDLLTTYETGSPYSAERPSAGSFSINPRRGLRRWRAYEALAGRAERVIEVHDDGGVGIADYNWASGGRDGFKNNHIGMSEVLLFASNLVSLLVATARALQLDSGYVLRLTMFTDSPDAIYVRSLDRQGRPVPLDQLAPIPRFIPVDGAIEPTSGDEAILSALREIATDLVNQGGILDIGTRDIRASMVDV